MCVTARKERGSEIGSKGEEKIEECVCVCVKERESERESAVKEKEQNKAECR